MMNGTKVFDEYQSFRNNLQIFDSVDLWINGELHKGYVVDDVDVQPRSKLVILYACKVKSSSNDGSHLSLNWLIRDTTKEDFRITSPLCQFSQELVLDRNKIKMLSVSARANQPILLPAGTSTKSPQLPSLSLQSSSRASTTSSSIVSLSERKPFLDLNIYDPVFYRKDRKGEKLHGWVSSMQLVCREWINYATRPPTRVKEISKVFDLEIVYWDIQLGKVDVLKTTSSNNQITLPITADVYRGRVLSKFEIESARADHEDELAKRCVTIEFGYTGICGVINLGNTCYITSSFMLMNAIPELRQFLASGTFFDQINHDQTWSKQGRFVHILAAAFKAIALSGSVKFNPHFLVTIIKQSIVGFDNSSQQDVDECFKNVMDFVHNDVRIGGDKTKSHETPKNLNESLKMWNVAMSDDNSEVYRLFSCQERQSHICTLTDCEKTNLSYDIITNFQLIIPPVFNVFITLFHHGRPLVLVSLQFPSNDVSIDDIKKKLIEVAFKKEGVRIPRMDEILLSFCRQDQKSNIHQDLSKVNMTLYELEMSIEDIWIGPANEKCNYNAHVVPRVQQVPQEEQANQMQEEQMKRDDNGGDFYTHVVFRYKSAAGELIPFGDTRFFPLNFVNGKQITGTGILLNCDVHSEIKRLFPIFVSGGFTLQQSTEKKDIYSTYLIEGKPLPDDNQPFGSIVDEKMDAPNIFIDLTQEQFNATKDERSLSLIRAETIVGPRIGLNDCFRYHYQDETMNDDNKYNCGHCGGKTTSAKTTSIWRLGKVLFVSLGRFNSEFEKIKTFVDYPPSIDMTEFVHKDAPNPDNVSRVYDLIAVSCHLGDTMMLGHYVTRAYNYYTKKWCEINDESVHTFLRNPGSSPSAYILIYRRRDDGDEYTVE